ncbi:pathogenesis-related protein STH-21-like [Punica granatum]|uniref:Uncharacterized protein n=2 Tax=Punica granatum TaxID=22663 RepID=A0A2I0JLB5_PUNGR|nr:pathogenesis-related protein STH-21-like [Punica granatum]PKI56710.1 hypothetical protein CRG98_022870 [Punica granatum]
MSPALTKRSFFLFPRDRAVKAFVIDEYNLIPKLLPQLINENYIYKATLIKGGNGTLWEKVDSIVYEVRYVTSGPDKCIVKVAGEYHLKEGITLEEDDIERNHHTNKRFYEIMAAYLVANPITYT